MYNNFSDEELIEAYKSMVAYSGKANDEMQKAIEQRGGIESFTKKIETQKEHRVERDRVTKEVYDLTNTESDLAFVRKLITSSILSEKELDELVAERFMNYQALLKNKTVNAQTIWGSAIGVVVGSIVGSLFLILATRLLDGLFYFLLIPTYIINYFILRLLTKQTRENVVIFFATFIATIFSMLLALLIAFSFRP
jgi:hypothetical protein